ncbi:MAG: hypothetical protein AAGI17_01670 [Planctomycetota bacterium]
MRFEVRAYRLMAWIAVAALAASLVSAVAAGQRVSEPATTTRENRWAIPMTPGCAALLLASTACVIGTAPIRMLRGRAA